MAKHRVVDDPDLLVLARTKGVPDVVLPAVLLPVAPAARRVGR